IVGALIVIFILHFLYGFLCIPICQGSDKKISYPGGPPVWELVCNPIRTYECIIIRSILLIPTTYGEWYEMLPECWLLVMRIIWPFTLIFALVRLIEKVAKKLKEILTFH
ncbi:MAG: hypothetical protein DRJ41_04270, partial [Thermoprotei archaeon]